ncbi:uncharacterized protein LOC142342486 [Convolutriloba macropyga]|uniref:uncharacterized protein LOC142342486 n=1 Tax=Convolutriloba macropyga TaxID=536237 RepID=UPI003F51F1D2
MENREVDTDIMEWAVSKDCSKTVSFKVASVLNKFTLRELKEWMQTDFSTFVLFCRQDLDLQGAELLDFSSALRDTEW